MEIERKFLIDKLPDDLKHYPCHIIEQAYLCTEPVVRIRRQDDDYILTYKSKGLMIREEANLPLNQEAYRHLLQKADGNIISKKRYLIPLDGGLTIEMDIFSAPLTLYMAEVEFGSEEEALSFTPPDWFGKEVTYDPSYQNSHLSSHNF